MKALFIKIFLLYSIALSAQNTFNLRYHFGYPASILTSIEDTDSCYYAMGVFADSIFPYRASNLFVKFGLDGTILSTKILTNTNKTYETWKNTFKPTLDGNFINAGYSVDSTMKLILIKYNSEGDTLFTREYFNPFHPIESFTTFQGLEIDPIDSSYLIVSVIIDPFAQANYTYLFKTNANGDMIWDKIIYHSSGLNNSPRTLKMLPDREFLIGAEIDNTNIVANNYIYRTYLVKTDSLGDILWQYLSPGNELQVAAYDILPTTDGGFVLASGKAFEHVNGNSSVLLWDQYVYKIDSDHNLVWGLSLRDSIETASDNLTKLIEASDGSGYIVVGSIHNVNYEENGWDINGLVAKISPEGDSLWIRKYNYVESPADYHIFYDVEETADGGFIMVGQAQDYYLEGESPLQRAWLVKLDQYGCLVPGCHLIDAVEEPSFTLKLDIYPNPVSDYLNVFYYDPNHRGKVNFSIVDIQGSILKQFNSTVNNITHILAVNDLPAGSYFLTMQSERGMVSKPFIIGK